ncbi:hypothetical protein ACEN8K_44735, partial [Variovorax sp. CT11-76]
MVIAPVCMKDANHAARGDRTQGKKSLAPGVSAVRRRWRGLAALQPAQPASMAATGTASAAAIA